MGILNQNNGLKVRFCQNCGASMNDPASIVIEYWMADRTVNFCWCHECGWKGEVTDVVAFITSELEGE